MADYQAMYERYLKRVERINDVFGEIVEVAMSYEEFCDNCYEANREY